MPARRENTKDYEKVFEKLDELDETHREEVEKQLEKIKEDIDELVADFGYQPIFEIGKLLCEEEEEWNALKDDYYGGYPWSSFEHLLGQNFQGGQPYIKRSRLFYQRCIRYGDEAGKIRELGNRVPVSKAVNQYRKMDELKTSEEISAWLKTLIGREDDLEKEIWSRSTELVAQYGIRLVDRQVKIQEVPAIDIVGFRESVLLPIELKERECNYEAVGELLSCVSKLDFIQSEIMKQGKLWQLSTKRIADAYPAQRLS